MPIEFRKHITRQMLRDNPRALFVFGDNMARSGYGGQAAEMRNEPNAVGLPTKWTPSMSQDAFFSDKDLDLVAKAALDDFWRITHHCVSGGTVIWPEDGIGTGRAQLAARAPRIAKFYALFLEQLKMIGTKP